MADNVTTQAATLATIPSSTSIATDDIGGIHYQRIKLVDGILDGTTALEFNVDDFDTGAGIDNQTLVGLAVAAGGGHAAVTGDVANGLDVDVTRLPSISGTVTANAGTGTFVVDSELPTAAALADGATNPTTPLVGAALLGFNGATWDRVRLCNVQYDVSTVTITTIATIATPTIGKKLRLLGGTISVSAAMSVLFEDNAGGTTVFRTPKLLVDTPFNFVVRNGQGYLLGAANNVLKATGSAAGTIIGTLFAVEE